MPVPRTVSYHSGELKFVCYVFRHLDVGHVYQDEVSTLGSLRKGGGVSIKTSLSGYTTLLIETHSVR